MGLCRCVGLVLLLTAAAVHSDQQSSEAAGQQPSAADQLAVLLGPVVEAAVSRVLAAERTAQQECAADAGQRALTELGRLEGRLEGRLDQLSQEVTALKVALVDHCAAEPEPEPACERHPAPKPVGSAPHQDPAVRVCARSCLQLRDQGGSPQDGVYWFTGMPVPVLCDFSHDGGGWTLLLTAVSVDGWDPLSALGRNRRSPSLTDNYSILQHADAIRNLGNGSRFAYRIEGQAQTGRQRWGGIWLAPSSYSFIHESPSQTNVTLYRKFDTWDYKDIGIEKRMPWLNTGTGDAVLTTSASAKREWWGTLVSIKTHTFYKHSPWINAEAWDSGIMLYWMREEYV